VQYLVESKIAKRYRFVNIQSLKKKKKERKKEKDIKVFGFSPGCHFDTTAIGFLLVFLLYCSIPEDRITHCKHQLVSASLPTHRQRVSSLFLSCFHSKGLSPGPVLQGHAIASKKHGEVFARNQQYRNHQGETAMQLNS